MKVVKLTSETTLENALTVLKKSEKFHKNIGHIDHPPK